MNKKIIILIVALECIFAVFLISVFGPMVESLHTKKSVKEIYFLDDKGNRMENDSSFFVDLQVSRSFHYEFVINPSDATDRTVKVIHNRSDEEIEIEMDANGSGFTVHFLSKDVASLKITVRANDSSQKQAIITLNKRLTDINIGDDF